MGFVLICGIGEKDGCEHRIKSENKSAQGTEGTHIHPRGPGGVGRGVDLPSPHVLEGEDCPGLLCLHSLHSARNLRVSERRKLRTSAEM